MSIAQTRLFQGYLDSRLGMIHMLLDQNGALIRLDFSERPEYRDAILDQQAAAAVCLQLREYLCGTRQTFDIPLAPAGRSEEHTSELQSHHDLVCRLLLEK